MSTPAQGSRNPDGLAGGAGTNSSLAGAGGTIRGGRLTPIRPASGSAETSASRTGRCRACTTVVPMPAGMPPSSRAVPASRWPR